MMEKGSSLTRWLLTIGATCIAAAIGAGFVQYSKVEVHGAEMAALREELRESRADRAQLHKDDAELQKAIASIDKSLAEIKVMLRAHIKEQP